jgi:uncharacterized protein (DUF736 family)
MATIGTFTKGDESYTGTIRTLTVNVKVKLVPAEKSSDKSLDFRLFAGPVECGAAWSRAPKDGGGRAVCAQNRRRLC